jgi:hypothetical protein
MNNITSIKDNNLFDYQLQNPIEPTTQSKTFEEFSYIKSDLYENSLIIHENENPLFEKQVQNPFESLLLNPKEMIFNDRTHSPEKKSLDQDSSHTNLLNTSNQLSKKTQKINYTYKKISHTINKARNTCYKALTRGYTKTKFKGKDALHRAVFMEFKNAGLNSIDSQDLKKIRFERIIQDYVSGKSTALQEKTKDEIDKNEPLKKHLMKYLGITSTESTFPHGMPGFWQLSNDRTGISDLQKQIKMQLQKTFKNITRDSILKAYFIECSYKN